MSQSYLTRQGLKKLREEFDYLVSIGRVESAQRIKAAIDSGGYEDNLLYDIELDKQTQLERRISELEALLREAKVIEEPLGRKKTVDFVTIGSVVVVESDGEKDKFRIVGSYEANPLKKMISNESPVGLALLGTKVGDVVEVNTPVVKLRYKVLEVFYE